VEDFFRVKTFLEGLKEKGVQDFRKYFDQNPDVVSYCAGMVKIVDVNKKTLELYKVSNKAALKGNLRMVFAKDSYKVFKECLVAIAQGRKSFECEAVNKTAQGKIIHIYIKWVVPSVYTKDYCRMFVSIMDITRKKQFEEELLNLNKELVKANKKLKQMALKDLHTGLYNHHYFGEILEREFSRAKRYNYPVSLMMIDIDHFKSINDVYGHRFGDLVLKQFAAYLKKSFRKYDVVVRFGGEEFLVVSPATDRDTALRLAERLRDDLGRVNFGNKKNTVKIRLSLGVVSYPEDRAGQPRDLVDLLSRVIERAKEDGGNRVYSSYDVFNSHKRPIAGRAEKVKFLKERLDKLTRKANQSLIEAVFAFARTIKLKDHYTGEHVESTVYYATETAKKLGLSKEEIEMVRQAAILHDLGKVGVSERILNKRAKLTKKEFEEIKKHPKIAVDIIRPIQFLHALIPFILYHHERWDGKGYPVGLKAEDIPIGARIIAIADTYHALISNRSYRKAFPKSKAIEIIKKEAGAKFDPKVVDAFLSIFYKNP